MMSIQDVMTTADRAANVVWQAVAGTSAFGWRDSVGRVRVGVAAQYVTANRDRTAEDLYAFLIATAGEADAVAWEKTAPAVRVAVETFRATFLTLLIEAEKQPWRSKPNPRVSGTVRAFLPRVVAGETVP